MNGFVYFGVSGEDIHRVDVFEADAYDRRTHTVVVEDSEKHRADAYVRKEEHSYLIDDCAWDPQWFARQALSSFVRDHRGFH